MKYKQPKKTENKAERKAIFYTIYTVLGIVVIGILFYLWPKTMGWVIIIGLFAFMALIVIILIYLSILSNLEEKEHDKR